MTFSFNSVSSGETSGQLITTMTFSFNSSCFNKACRGQGGELSNSYIMFENWFTCPSCVISICKLCLFMKNYIVHVLVELSFSTIMDVPSGNMQCACF